MTTDDVGPRSAAVFLSTLAGGALHAQLSEALRELGARLHTESQNRDAKVTGSLSLTLKFTAAPSGLVEVSYDLSTKIPPGKTPVGHAWIGPGGNFVQQDPRQQVLPLREVAAAAAAPPREVRSGEGSSQ